MSSAPSSSAPSSVPSSASSVRRPSNDPMVGVVINGRYRIVGIAGSGGMGTVYKAEQIPLGRMAALKVLNSAFTGASNDSDFHKRFFLEASILSHLQHPNIVTVFDYGCVEGADPEMYFMAMEYLAGETLERRLRTRGRMDASELFPIVRQVARGLADAHGHGVVHRDLKPANVMLVQRPDGTVLVKIVDFGLVKVVGADSDQITREGTFQGSVRYMAPEQITSGPVDARTDVYALGVLMFEALCGAPPFAREQMVQTLVAHIRDPVPEMASIAPNAFVPEPVEAFVRRCLAKDPAERPADMGQVLDAIALCGASLGFPSVTFDRYDMDIGLITTEAHADTLPDAGRVPEGGTLPDAGPLADVGVRPVLDTQLRSVSGASSAITDSAAERDMDSVHSSAPASSTKRWIVVGAVGTVVVGVVALILNGLVAQSSESSGHAAAPLGSSAAPAEPDFGRTFVLWIDSTPTGAEVREGESLLGTTPMQMSIENQAVRAAPKRLTIISPGHTPYSLVQGPSDGNVRVAAALQPMADTTATKAPTKATTKTPSNPRVVPTSTGRPTSTSRTPSDTDIRTHR